MAWRPIIEMSGAMLAEVPLLLVAYWLGFVTNVRTGGVTTLWWWQHGLMAPAMLAAMFLRLDLYTGRMGNQVSRG